MFDIDSGKLLIVAVLALIVIGPKELPRVLRQVGQSVGKLRRMAGEFQGQFMDAMKEADLADIRKDLDEMNKSAALDVHFDPARDIQSEFTSAMRGSVISATGNTASPTENYALPPLPGEEAALGSVSAGIAPVADPAELTTIEPEAALIDQAPTAPMLFEDQAPELAPIDGVMPGASLRGKRKIAVRRRTSRINVMQSEHEANRTGEPFIVRRRTVRARSGAAEPLATT